MQNQLKIKGVNPEEIPEDKIPQRAGITSNTLRLVSRAQGEKKWSGMPWVPSHGSPAIL